MYYMFAEIKQDDQDYLMKIEKETASFFKDIGGKLVYFRYIKTPTYSSYNFKIPCINYYILFSNRRLFGAGNFTTEVYPRYRKMRDNWKKHLQGQGIKLLPHLAVGFVPILSLSKKDSRKVFEYKKETNKPLGAKILAIGKDSPAYYRKMSKELGVKYMLQEKGGMFVGPEMGMMYTLKSICSVKNINCMIDIGAGTGEISAYVLKNCNPKKIIVNELSAKLGSHLKRYLNKENVSKADIIFSFIDCSKIKIPEHVDLISLGVFYGSQPYFIKSKNAKIIKSLGRNGLLFIQSAMPETIFSQHILMGDLNEVKKWPWYSKEFTLLNHFSCVESFFIDNQFIILASQSHNLVQQVTNNIRENIIKYIDFQLKNKIKKI